ncbi:MAG: EthD domain-containing protein [Myxococcota bacterium]
MVKLLSVKTRRSGSTRAAFRRHYEERHVPLGLGFIDRFRWRKYVRNHVLDVASGEVDFDCLTEFWFATRADQASTARFAATDEFRVLDEDDRRFLDVDRRLACELGEAVLAGERPPCDPPGTRRVAALFSLPAGRLEGGGEAFVAAVERDARSLAAEAVAAGGWLSFDRRVTSGPRPEAFAAIVSLWSAPGREPAPLRWKGEAEPAAVVLLDVVETPPARLYRAA